MHNFFLFTSIDKKETPKGETHEDRNKFEERNWTNEPLKFDNSYFK